MTALILQPLRWQLGMTALLALVSALVAGVWLAAAPSAKGSLSVYLPRRGLPRVSAGGSNEALQGQKQSMLNEQNQIVTQLKQREDEWQRLQLKVANTEQQMKSVDSGGSPELLAVKSLRNQAPKWDGLGLQPEEVKTINLVWDSKNTDVESAIGILNRSRQTWLDRAANTAKSGAVSRDRKLETLREMRKRFDQDSAVLVAVLRVDDLSAEKTDPILAEVNKQLMTMIGGSRAVAGQNFTNSVGMEMVWVADGGFWMGRTEVSSAAYRALTGGTGGDDSPADGLSFFNSANFCKALNQRETQEVPDLASERLMMPLDANYGLPGVKQWQLARDHAGALGMSGFADNLHEWTMDKASSGLVNKNLAFGAKPQPFFFIVCRDTTAEALPYNTTSEYIQTGTGGTITLWAGRLGFRVILVPSQAP